MIAWIMTSPITINQSERETLANDIRQWGAELGFDAIGIADLGLSEHEDHLNRWLELNRHGEMEYMQRHGSKRSRPQELVPGTLSVITARLDYAPTDIENAENVLEQGDIAYISRYALGRDYHKVMRAKLKKLAMKIEARIGPIGYRVFSDSAPVLEKALAEKSGLGWIGKHTNLLDSKTGSWFFLGELFLDIELPTDETASNHCGSCQRCIEVCPTQAIVAPYELDARKCISYLTIELKGEIPQEFRSSIGNRVYGCDDCQLFCPWNKFAQSSREDDFKPRKDLHDRELLALFEWDEETFLSNTEGSAIRRIGYQSWLRNLAVGLGNAPYSQKVIESLQARLGSCSDLVDEHINWALSEQYAKQADVTEG